MEKMQEIQKSPIFEGISENDINAMANCFKIRFKKYNKNALIVSQGQPFEDVFVVIKGGAKIENIDALGDVSIVTELKEGDAFGIEGAYAGETFYTDNLVATENCSVMILNKHRLIHPCQNRCKRHEQVIYKLIQLIANRNLKLLNKLNHLSKKNIRRKVLSYLYSQSKIAKSSYFDIPFNKTELASYLAVDRSALSTELSKLKNENVIDFEKKHYHIIDKSEDVD